MEKTVKHLLDRGLSDEEAEKARAAAQKNAGIVGKVKSFEYNGDSGYGRTVYELKEGK